MVLFELSSELESAPQPVKTKASTINTALANAFAHLGG
jgi:hypothetical protein